MDEYRYAPLCGHVRRTYSRGLPHLPPGGGKRAVMVTGWRPRPGGTRLASAGPMRSGLPTAGKQQRKGREEKVSPGRALHAANALCHRERRRPYGPGFHGNPVSHTDGTP